MAKSYWMEDETYTYRGVDAVLEIRQSYIDQGETLSDLYDPRYMAGDLLKAHQKLDTAVAAVTASGVSQMNGIV